MNAPAARRTYLDVLRGVAVLVMIEAHVIDAWTQTADRPTRAFGKSLILGGFGAPLFLFLAGVGVAMSAGSKARRSGDPGAAARAVEKRGLQIFLLAFLFRLQSVVVSRGETWTLLKIDILNIMGLSILAAAFIWGQARSTRARLLWFAAAAALFVWGAPAIRAVTALSGLPDWLEGYVRPIPSNKDLSNFTFFPWTGFVMAGAMVGVLLDAARDPRSDRRLNLSCVTGGVLLALAAYGGSFMPPLDPRSRFWTTSSSFFFIRLGVMLAALGLCYLWEQRPVRQRASGSRRSPLQLLGRNSLFIYWIHVEMVYGLISLPLHRSLTLPQAWAALGVFCLLMLAAAAVKEWAVDKFNHGSSLRKQTGGAAQPLMF